MVIYIGSHLGLLELGFGSHLGLLERSGVEMNAEGGAM